MRPPPAPRSSPPLRSLPLALAALVLAPCCERAREPKPEQPEAVRIDAALGRLTGTLKLAGDAYVAAVADRQVRDAAAYARAGELLRRTRTEWAAVADAAGRIDRASQRRLAYALDSLDSHLAAKGATERAGELVEAGLHAAAGLASDRPPPELLGLREQIVAADVAILAELVVGDLRLGLGAGPARTQYLPAPGARMAAAPSRHAGWYVLLVVRDRATKRFLPRARVELLLEGAPLAVPLVETWGEFPHFGSNLYLPEGRLFTLDATVGAPQVDRRPAASTWHASPARARFTCLLRDGALHVEGRLPAPALSPPGADLLAARKAAAGLVSSGPYAVGLLSGPAEPIGRWREGRVVEEAAPAGSLQLGVVLLDQATGSQLPGARLALELTPVNGGAPLKLPLAFLLGGPGDAFDRYATNASPPTGTYRVRVDVVRPALATLAAERLARGASIEVPGTWTR